MGITLWMHLGKALGRSDSLYNLYASCIEKLEMPVYSTLGNHEVFGIYESSGIDASHEEYGKKMFENRLHKRYYSFGHKDWHFIVLDGIGLKDSHHYYGFVDSVQVEWLKKRPSKSWKRNTCCGFHTYPTIECRFSNYARPHKRNG